MFNLRNVLQLVVYSFYDGPPSQQQSVRHTHERAPHIVLQFRYQLYTVDKKTLEKAFAYISFVHHEPAIKELHKSLVFKRFSIINIARRYHEVQQLPFLVAYDV